MRKLLTLSLSMAGLISSSYAETKINNYTFSNLDDTIQVTVTQYVDKIAKVSGQYISNIKLVNITDNCSVELNPITPCSGHSINFCSYQINRPHYQINGLIGASYASPLFQTAIKLTGIVNKNNCVINSFGYVDLYPTNNQQLSI